MNKYHQEYLYRWKALTAEGFFQEGKYLAAHKDIVKDYLQQKQLLPLKIQRQFQVLKSNKKLSIANLAQFTQQLATLIDANIPLAQCFYLLENTVTNPKLQMITQQIAKQLHSGLSLQMVFHQYRDIFPKLFLAFITVGEQTGTLSNVLFSLTKYYQKQNELFSKIRKALWYPLAVLIIASLVTMIMLNFVIPQLSNLFINSGQSLPVLTQFIVNVATFFRHCQIEILILLSTLIMFIYHHSYKLNFIWNYLFKIPFLKKILTYITLTHFAQTLAISFAAGISLLESLPLTLQVSSDPLLKAKSQQICQHLKDGHTLHHALASAHYFPILFLQAITIGETTGTLEKNLTQTSLHYENLLSQTLDNFIALLEPSLILILGLVVGFLLIALYLPLFNLASVI